jgi:hypothetical protein
MLHACGDNKCIQSFCGKPEEELVTPLFFCLEVCQEYPHKYYLVLSFIKIILDVVLL